MRLIDWIGIGSAIVSVISLILTIIESRKAKKASEIAETAKNSILERKSAIDLTKLLEEAKNLEKILIKVTTPNKSTNRGLDDQKIHEAIEKFLSLLNELLGIGLEQDYNNILKAEYDIINKANCEQPRPHQPILDHTRIVIQQTNRYINSKVYSI